MKMFEQTSKRSSVKHRPLGGWLMLGLLVLATAAACEPIDPCGKFDFTGSASDTGTANGVDMNLEFDFNPDACGSSATCNAVVYVQIVRTVDMEDFTYLYPSTEKQNRATSSGWYIDRIPNRIWGYYGRNDDGTFASNLDPGSDTDPAVLFDAPSRPEVEPWLNIWWQAVSVPVCIQAESKVNNNLLGYYTWTWLADEDGKVDGPIHWVSTGSSDDQVDESVGEWNEDAPALGKNLFPAFTRLTL